MGVRGKDASLDSRSKEALYVRRLGRKVPQTFELYREFVETRPPDVVANIAVCLIQQANYLIDQQLRPWRTISSNKGACASA